MGLLFSRSGFGQINEADTTRWQYRVAATGILLSGNVNDFITSARAEVAENGPRWACSRALPTCINGVKMSWLPAM
ncbi:hypothetical protein A0257_04050 [Hymenobacter psoromatis]|nr:hypothetical protein A0257_04050 [Hymenobacter psoromatis]